MKLLLAFISFLFILSGCEKDLCAEADPESQTCLLPTETTEITPSPEADGFDARVSLANFEKEDEIKVEKALELIKEVVRSQEFKEKVINFTYKGQRAYVDNGGHSNEEIYQKLLEGSEELQPDIDYEMDLELELYYSSSSTVGYTYAHSSRVWMNTKFFNSYSVNEVAGNIFHEWTHKLGFDHASSYSVSRDSSVPYALGYLMEELSQHHE